LHLQVGGENDFGRQTRCIGMHRLVAALISTELRNMVERETLSACGAASGLPLLRPLSPPVLFSLFSLFFSSSHWSLAFPFPRRRRRLLARLLSHALMHEHMYARTHTCTRASTGHGEKRSADRAGESLNPSKRMCADQNNRNQQSNKPETLNIPKPEKSKP
jgi:hypothetical protein